MTVSPDEVASPPNPGHSSVIQHSARIGFGSGGRRQLQSLSSSELPRVAVTPVQTALRNGLRAPLRCSAKQHGLKCHTGPPADGCPAVAGPHCSISKEEADVHHRATWISADEELLLLGLHLSFWRSRTDDACPYRPSLQRTGKSSRRIISIPKIGNL